MLHFEFDLLPRFMRELVWMLRNREYMDRIKTLLEDPIRVRWTVPDYANPENAYIQEADLPAKVALQAVIYALDKAAMELGCIESADRKERAVGRIKKQKYF